MFRFFSNPQFTSSTSFFFAPIASCSLTFPSIQLRIIQVWTFVVLIQGHGRFRKQRQQEFPSWVARVVSKVLLWYLSTVIFLSIRSPNLILMKIVRLEEIFKPLPQKLKSCCVKGSWAFATNFLRLKVPARLRNFLALLTWHLKDSLGSPPRFYYQERQPVLVKKDFSQKQQRWRPEMVWLCFLTTKFWFIVGFHVTLTSWMNHNHAYQGLPSRHHKET